MTERLLHPDSLEASAAPAYLRERARTEGKQIKQIIWDRAGGHPRHAWGFIQWSLRPFEQRGGCDGTTDPNIHLIALCLCEALGLDYPALYEKAYAWKGEQPGQSWLRFYNWAAVAPETIVPEPSEQALRDLLHDLAEINNRSVVAVLEEAFTRLGYDVAGW